MTTLARLVDRGLMAPDWADALAPVEPDLAALEAFLAAEVAAGRPYLPAPDRVFRAFQAPLADARVLVVGQDPYPDPGHAIGLSFAVERHVRPLPGSLRNIYAELERDLGVEPPAHGDLSAWSEQGVVLLNRVLTVEAGRRDSHKRAGWKKVTAHAVDALAARHAAGQPLVAVLWGAQARELSRRLGDLPTVASGHPSPFSVNLGGDFPGSRPFSRANALLAAQGAAPVDWGAIAAPRE